eukprot:1405950-Rhodomonas_salina.4
MEMNAGSSGSSSSSSSAPPRRFGTTSCATTPTSPRQHHGDVCEHPPRPAPNSAGVEQTKHPITGKHLPRGEGASRCTPGSRRTDVSARHCFASADGARRAATCTGWASDGRSSNIGSGWVHFSPAQNLQYTCHPRLPSQAPPHSTLSRAAQLPTAAAETTLAELHAALQPAAPHLAVPEAVDGGGRLGHVEAHVAEGLARRVLVLLGRDPVLVHAPVALPRQLQRLHVAVPAHQRHRVPPRLVLRFAHICCQPRAHTKCKRTLQCVPTQMSSGHRGMVSIPARALLPRVRASCRSPRAAGRATRAVSSRHVRARGGAGRLGPF